MLATEAREKMAQSALAQRVCAVPEEHTSTWPREGRGPSLAQLQILSKALRITSPYEPLPNADYADALEKLIVASSDQRETKVSAACPCFPFWRRLASVVDRKHLITQPLISGGLKQKLLIHAHETCKLLSTATTAYAFLLQTLILHPSSLCAKPPLIRCALML